MRRGVMTTEAEIRWHDELDAVLAEPLAASPRSARCAAAPSR
jgi:hypothetical protein